MKVQFIYNSGRERSMARRYAEILRKLGHGTYVSAAGPVTEPAQGDLVLTGHAGATVNDGLDALTAEELHALARDRGVQLHHRAGADKARAALREVAQ